MPKKEDFARRSRREWETARKVIGDNLHYHRQRKAISLQKLARLTGISADRIDRFEIGRDMPDLRHIAQLATALGVNVGDLFYQ